MKSEVTPKRENEIKVLWRKQWIWKILNFLKILIFSISYHQEYFLQKKYYSLVIISLDYQFFQNCKENFLNDSS